MRQENLANRLMSYTKRPRSSKTIRTMLLYECGLVENNIQRKDPANR